MITQEPLPVTFYECSGVLRYSMTGGYRLIVDIPCDLGNYYRALAPKYLHLRRPMYPTHITVVRPEKDVPKNLAAWGKYEGETVKFLYEARVTHGKQYYWLRVLSKLLEDIRTELGLGLERSKTPSDASYEEPPQPYVKFFHCTVANTKA